jgi:hypothetical protein
MPRQLLRDKPIATLRTFARRLGWSPLRCRQQRFEDQKPLTTWYVSGNNDGSRNAMFLQINECPIGQTAAYTAAVYAIRYRICSGWHAVRLNKDSDQIRDEAERLDPWRHHRWFQSVANRRQYRIAHPECTGWSWKRVRHERPPYVVVDAIRCITARSV